MTEWGIECFHQCCAEEVRHAHHEPPERCAECKTVVAAAQSPAAAALEAKALRIADKKRSNHEQ